MAFLVAYEVGKICTIYQNDQEKVLKTNSTDFGRCEIYRIEKLEKSKKSYAKPRYFPAKKVKKKSVVH
jgi:hypothetical protein